MELAQGEMVTERPLPAAVAEDARLLPAAGAVKRQRLVFLDGLRGLAAVAVVLFHWVLVIHDHPISTPQPLIFKLLAIYGRLGVEVFFVLSGFVISYSLQNSAITFGFAARFVLRRSIRLDPPYWCTIVFAVAVALTATHLFGAKHYAVPELGDVLPHLLYLQGILGHPHVVIVFWTLCIEVQFYLVFIGLLAALHYGRKSATPPLQSKLFAALLCASALGSLLMSTSTDLPVDFFECWFMFCLGALVCRAVQLKDYRLAAAATVCVGLASIVKEDLNAAVASLAAGLILAAAVLNGLNRWLGNPVSQFFGRISYSLYLTHFLVLLPVIHFCYRLSPDSLAMSLVGNALALGATTLVAYLLYRFVERPSVLLASRLKSSPQRTEIGNACRHVHTVRFSTVQQTAG